MKNLRFCVAAITLLFILSFLSPLAAAEDNDEDTSFRGVTFVDWQAMTPEQKSYNIRFALDERGIGYSSWNMDKWKHQLEYDVMGSYEIYENICGYQFHFEGTTPGGIIAQYTDSGISKLEDNGVLDFTDYSGGGGFSGGEHGGGGSGGHRTPNDYARDDFYNNASGSSGTTFDFGNGYSVKVGYKMRSPVESDTRYTHGYQIVLDIYFNDELMSHLENAIIQAQYNAQMRFLSEPVFYIKNNHLFVKGDFQWAWVWPTTFYTASYDSDCYDLTTYINYIPSDSSADDIVPRVIHPVSPGDDLPPDPVDGDDQKAVNEELVSQNNDILSWLEKIYNEECIINSTINSLNNTFLSSFNSLKNILQSLLSNGQAILQKMQDLKVKVKDSKGNDIDFGDLKLGDINVDFDIVYNITGITKVEKPSDLTKDFGTYRSQIESKFGISNMKRNINNYTNVIFGHTVFNDQGNLVAVSYSNTSSAPHIYFTFMGAQCDLFSFLSSFRQEDINKFKEIASYFMYFGVALGIFRSLPSVLGGVAGIHNHHEMVEQANFVADDVYRNYESTGRVSYNPWITGRWI